MDDKVKKTLTAEDVRGRLSRLGIYDLKAFARALGFRPVANLTRHELIDILCVIDMTFNLNKLEMFLFVRGLLTGG